MLWVGAFVFLGADHRRSTVIRLKFERINRGITQQRLALAARLPQPVVSLIETGTLNPTPRQLEALAAALRVAPPTLLLQDVAQPTWSPR